MRSPAWSSAVLAIADTTKTEVTARDITFVKGDKKQRFARSQIGMVVIDGSHLVLRGPGPTLI